MAIRTLCLDVMIRQTNMSNSQVFSGPYFHIDSHITSGTRQTKFYRIIYMGFTLQTTHKYFLDFAYIQVSRLLKLLTLLAYLSR